MTPFESQVAENVSLRCSGAQKKCRETDKGCLQRATSIKAKETLLQILYLVIVTYEKYILGIVRPHLLHCHSQDPSRSFCLLLLVLCLDRQSCNVGRLRMLTGLALHFTPVNFDYLHMAFQSSDSIHTTDQVSITPYWAIHCSDML